MRTFAIFFLFTLQIAFGLETRLLRPPNLGSEAIGRKIVCYRPMRDSIPNFSLEEQGKKILIHNYGHGGAGWSLSVGSVFYSYNLLKEALPYLKKSTPIAIVGSGCIGLFTAYHLWNEGFKNITIYTKKFEDLTSHHAGGLLSYRAVYSNQDANRLILKMGEETYGFFRLIAEGECPDFPMGASVLPTYFESLVDSELEDLVGRGMQPAKEVVVDFGSGVKREMIVYDDSLFIDTGAMMDQLKSYLCPKISFNKHTVKAFADLQERIIFNCTGLGAKELNQDDHMYPVEGHLIMLQNQKPEELQYMLIVNFELEEDENKKIFRTLDFFPKKLSCAAFDEIGVLGGTFIENCDTLELKIDEFELMLDRAKHFFYQNNIPQNNP